MRISELLLSIASWLENPDNEAMLLSEYNDECLKIVAESCITAADTLKTAAIKVDSIEPYESNLDEDSIDQIVNFAKVLDETGDIDLMRQASTIDELLYVLAKKVKTDEEKIEDAKKDIDKSNMTKEYRVLEAPLSTRSCPDHPGAQLARVGENRWQCDLDKKVYDFAVGYTLENGSKVPGSSVEQQSDVMHGTDNSVFDTREERLNN